MSNRLFNGFFMAGYECADHLNKYGNRVNLLQLTHHDEQVLGDYRALREAGITTVREGLCWSAVEPQPYHYNFREVKRRIAAAEECGIQQVWDLCHFGFPDDLYPTHPHFTNRFVALCRAFVSVFKQCSAQRLLVVPVNEISFLAWLGGDVRGTAPYAVNSGFDMKYHLCRAAIAGTAEIKDQDPEAVLLTSEPLIYVHANDTQDRDAANFNAYQYQALDMLTGRLCPELGGQESYVDVIGQNYYPNCQWHAGGSELPWPCPEQKRIPLATLLQQTWQRYGKPMWLSETSATGYWRGPWLREVALECIQAINGGVDMRGLCLYPALNRPDWDNPQQMHESGLWDCLPSGERVLNAPYFEVLQDLMRAFATERPGPQQERASVELTELLH